MQELVEECTKAFENFVAEKGGSIQISQLPDCRAHAPWVRRILDNYVSNAIKYGGSPPVVHVYSEEGEREDGAAVQRYWIADNGPGIPEEHQAELFQAFKRLEPNRAEGIGLGLNLVKRVAERMDGEVGLESAEGEGSRFYVELPA